MTAAQIYMANKILTEEYGGEISGDWIVNLIELGSEGTMLKISAINDRWIIEFNGAYKKIPDGAWRLP